MALGSETSIGTPIHAGGGLVYPCSVRGQPTLIHSDLTQTANTGAELLRPLSATTSYIVPAHLRSGTRISVWARYLRASTVTTNPVVRLYAVYGSLSSGASVDDGTVQWRRIDNSDANATGITLTISSGADGRDTTYAYTDEMPSTTVGYDAKGAWYILALVETAAVVSAGSVQLYAMALN